MNQNFVVDSSLALSWCFDDEATEPTQAVLDLFLEGARAVVPPLWVWECNNILTLAERAKRITSAQKLEKISLLRALPIDFDASAQDQCWTVTADIAQAQKMSIYDASYLELALRLNLALGSLDSELRASGKRVGAKILPAKI